MGTIFKYVADAALRSEPDEICQHCDSATVPIYNYQGEIADPGLVANAPLAQQEREVSYLCAACINGGNVVRTNKWAVENVVQTSATDPAKAWQEFNHLPDAPLFAQGDFDWPFCCDTWCEFHGSPANFHELLALQKADKYWESGPGKTPRNFKAEGPPESLREISKFVCVGCATRYYTDQFT